MASVPDGDDDFQKELLELFAQEAREWLGQTHQALQELTARPDADRHVALIKTITQGLTNLGGSAATVDLPEVERAAFALLPFVESIRDPVSVLTPKDFATIRQKILYIATVLIDTTGMAIDFEFGALPEAIQSDTLLKQLRRLQAEQASVSSRNFVQVIIDKVEQDTQQGINTIDRSSLDTLLNGLADTNEAFLSAVTRRLPTIARGVARLKVKVQDTGLSASEFDTTLREVSALQAAAQTVHATSVMTFLNGLRSFLTIVLQRRLTLASTKVEAVESRLNVVLAMAQEWVQVGRVELAAIDKLLLT